MKQINLTIPDEQYEYLERNPGINRSELFRQKIRETRADQAIENDYKKFQLFIVLISASDILFVLLFPLSISIVIIMVTLGAIVIESVLLLGRYYEVERRGFREIPRRGKRNK